MAQALIQFGVDKMTKFKIEHNVQTGQVTEIALTAEELQELESVRAVAQTEAATQATAETVKAAEKAALLKRLGITADEAKLLLF
jgi:hypothetical protein